MLNNGQYGIGIGLSGRKDVFGMWVGENVSAKYWMKVLNSLRDRSAEDVFIACTDNLTGFSNAIEAAFPRADIHYGSRLSDSILEDLTAEQFVEI